MFKVHEQLFVPLTHALKSIARFNIFVRRSLIKKRTNGADYTDHIYKLVVSGYRAISNFHRFARMRFGSKKFPMVPRSVGKKRQLVGVRLDCLRCGAAGPRTQIQFQDARNKWIDPNKQQNHNDDREFSHPSIAIKTPAPLHWKRAARFAFANEWNGETQSVNPINRQTGRTEIKTEKKLVPPNPNEPLARMNETRMRNSIRDRPDCGTIYKLIICR